MNERERTTTMLAQLMQNAARASITRGAIYDSGERISPPEECWEQVAAFVIGLVEGVVDDRIPRDKQKPGRDVVGT